MPQQPNISIENNFTKGLKTEFTGLNFPENAATDCDNVVFDLIGNVSRRPGVDYETNFTNATVTRSNSAINTYKWNNVAGDGVTQIEVAQVGSILYFYKSSSATILQPLSTRVLTSTVNLAGFLPAGGNANYAQYSCEFSTGNGYLFVYHPYLEPFYCSYAESTGVISSSVITVEIRDFKGIVETIEPENSMVVSTRPSDLTIEHQYNIANQGWGLFWTYLSTTTNTIGTGAFSFDIGVNNAPIKKGDIITVFYQLNTSDFMQGSVTSYVGTILNFQMSQSGGSGSFSAWTLKPAPALIDNWYNAVGNYPANADVWWSFKNGSGVFDPGTTATNFSLSSAPAPKGHFVLNAFNQDRSAVSALSGISASITTKRPKTGCWFQGRVWYAGADATPDWTENIYFSQLVDNPLQFGRCYQNNDPTDENLFDLLPTDGGLIQIQGCGSIYKLFAVQNGLFVFAANGIWFITGSQGIGFSANDYTITKISSIQSISSRSYVDVQGYPMFWNEEGIYSVTPSKQGGGFDVQPVTIGTILSFYDEIPLSSKKIATGAYNPIDYTVQWLYRDTDGSTTDDLYTFNKILNFNVANQSFYPFSVTAAPSLHSISYVAGPGGSTSPSPTFKYLTSTLISGTSYNLTFSELNDFTHWRDFFTHDSVGVDFTSYFITGYKIHGQAFKKFQPVYVYIYSNNSEPTQYKIQGIWNYATSGDTGKYTSVQIATVDEDDYSFAVRRHKIRGRGTSFQIKVTSVSGEPFDIVGWAIPESVNTGP